MKNFNLRISILFVLTSLFLSINASGQAPEINRLLDDWHRAAATADAKAFFDPIAEDGIYIGTDSSERWSKSQFYSFAKPYFDKGKAWDFKPYDRDLHISGDGSYAWFSELLTTWMGVCRGSGILVKKSGVWKISQYHLSVTVPNEIVSDFVKLVDNFHKQHQK